MATRARLQHDMEGQVRTQGRPAFFETFLNEQREQEQKAGHTIELEEGVYNASTRDRRPRPTGLARTGGYMAFFLFLLLSVPTSSAHLHLSLSPTRAVQGVPRAET